MANSMDGTLTIYTNVDTKGLNKGIKGITKQMNQLTATFKQFVGITGFILLGKQAVTAASDLAEYRNVALNTFKTLTGQLDEFLDTSIEVYGMSRLTATQIASGYQAMGNSIGLSKQEATDMAITLTGLAGDFASFYNLSQERARTALAAVYTGETETMKQYGVMLQEVNLQQYAYQTGINKSIKTMSAAEKTVLRYNYVMDALKDAQGDFARTAEQWANQVRVLKERWTEFMIVIGTGIKQVLTPVIQFMNIAIQKLIDFSNVVGNSLSKIFGIKWLKQAYVGTENLSDAMSDLADETEGAGKAAKHTLAPFDDLNVLGKNAASASGADTGLLSGLGLDDSDKGHIEEWYEEVESEFDTLYKLGKHISEVITDSLNSINWANIKQKAMNFGNGLSEFLNGLISPEVLTAIGSTIAEFFNTVVESSKQFAENLDWSNIGESISTGINEFFATFNFGKLANNIDAWVQGLFEALKRAVETIDWGEVFNGIKDFFSELDVETVTIIVGAIAFKGLTKSIVSGAFFKAIGNLVTGITKLPKITGVTAFFTKLGEVIGLVAGKAGTLHEAMMAIFGPGSIFASIAALVGGAVLAVKSFFDMWTDGFSWLKEILMVIGTIIAAVGAVILGIVTGPVAAIIAAVVVAVGTIAVLIKDNWDAICKFFVGIGTWIYDNVITPVVNFFNEMWNNISQFFSDAWTKISEVWGVVAEWFNTYVIQPVVIFFEGVTRRISQFFDGCWLIIQAIWKIVSEWFYSNVIKPVVNRFNALKTSISLIMMGAWKFVTDTWQKAADWFNTHVITPIKTLFNLIGAVIMSAFLNAKTFVTGIWYGAVAVFNDIKSKLEAPFNLIKQVIIDAFSIAWDTVSNTAKSAFNGILTFVETAINGIIDAINVPINLFNKVGSWAGKIVGIEYGGIDAIPKLNIPRLATGAVIPPNKEFLAMLGDQKHGTNIEAPLDTLVEAFEKAASKLVQQNNGEYRFVAELNGRTLFEEVVNQNQMMYNRTGRSPLVD